MIVLNLAIFTRSLGAISVIHLLIFHGGVDFFAVFDGGRGGLGISVISGITLIHHLVLIDPLRNRMNLVPIVHINIDHIVDRICNINAVFDVAVVILL